MDVVAMAAAGIRNCLAPLGTALTESQMQILWRYASEPILCFDGDKAGLNASFRSVDIALPNIGPEKSLRFVNLPEGKDPDDVLKSDGKAKMLELLSNNVPLSEMTVLRRLRGARADTPERKAALEKQLHSDVANIKDSIAAEHYRAHIKMRLLAFFGNTMASKSTPGTVKNILTKPAKLVEKIVLGLCVEHAELLPEYIEEIVQLQFEEAKYRDFVDHLYSLFLGENSRLPVHRVYELMPPHFYDVLGEVHGFEHSGNPDEDLSDQARARGHRLRELFPAIRFNPPIEIVSDTLALLLLKRRIDRTRHELNALLHDITYERLEAYRLSIESMIEDYDLAETYLDQEYQRLAVFSQQRAYT
jgi:DNA primase